MSKLPWLTRLRATIVREFIYGGHLLSLGATGIVLSVAFTMDLPINIFLFFIPYLSSQIVYNHNHLKELKQEKETNVERNKYLIEHKSSVNILLLSYIILLTFCLINTNIQTILIVVFIILGGLLYTQYFKRKTAEYFVGFKNIYTSFFWSLTIFLVPFFYGTSINSFYWFFFIFIFLRFIVSTAFFDIKDIKDDSEKSIKTFAVIFGKRLTLNVLQILNLISILPIIIGVYLGQIPVLNLVLILTLMYGIYYLTRAYTLDDRELRKLSYVVVDGEYLLWGLSVFFVRIFTKLI